MAGFTDSVLQKKLDDLNESQQSIQTLSLWLIHHRKHYQLVVRTWAKEVAKGTELQKLTLMYLANDVIQNSKKKGPEYTNEFFPVLKRAFQILSQMKCNPKTKQKLYRILQIWEERSVYDKTQVDELKRIFNYTPEPDQVSQPPAKRLKQDGDSLKPPDSRPPHNSNNADIPRRPQEFDELLRILTDFEKSTPIDSTVKEKVSKLPPELSEADVSSKLEDKEQALKLAERINAAFEVLTEYNSRLVQDLEERKKLYQVLCDCAAAHKQLMHKAECRFEEYKEKLSKIEQVRHKVLTYVYCDMQSAT